MKNHYRLITIELNWQKELDADLKEIQHIEFVKQLTKLDSNDNATDAACNYQSMPVLTILEKIKKTRLKFSQGSITVSWKMVNYQKARTNLTSTQLSKLKSAAKNKTEAILRINKKKLQYEELLHQLFQTTRQTTNISSSFANNMLTDIN